MPRQKPPAPENLTALRTLRRELGDIAREHPELMAAPGEAQPDAATWNTTLEGAMKDTDKTKQVAFRLPAPLLDRLDSYAEQLGREQRGMTFTRTDVVRLLLTRGLDDVEAQPKG